MIDKIDQIDKEKTIYLYGAGAGGKKAADLLAHYKVEGFIDDNKKGIYAGKKIYKLQDIQPSDDILILITSAYWHIITKKKQLQQYKYEILSPKLFYKDQTFSKSEFLEFKSLYNQVYAMLSTQKDKEVFEYIVQARIDDKKVEKLNQIYEERFKESIYLDFINKKCIDTIIEGGVLDGKNSLDFIQKINKNAIIYGFEPLWDEISNKVIVENENIKIIKKALYSKKSTLFFNKDETSMESSKLSFEQNSELQVQTVDIDSFMNDNALKGLDFIKLDIEGAELDVLKGASTSIIKHRPQIAVSIYHSKEELFSIPLFLQQICEDYIFHIGHYSKTYWDSVLYAVPKEKYLQKSGKNI